MDALAQFVMRVKLNIAILVLKRTSPQDTRAQPKGRPAWSGYPEAIRGLHPQ